MSNGTAAGAFIFILLFLIIGLSKVCGSCVDNYQENRAKKCMEVGPRWC